MREHIRIIVFDRLQGSPAPGMRGPYMKHADRVLQWPAYSTTNLHTRF